MPNTFVAQVQKQFTPHRFRQQEPLAPHTSFKSGGAAQFYCEVTTLSELMSLVALAYDHNIPVTLLGGGSYALISDNGVEGLVIKNNCRRFEMMSFQGRIHNRQLGVERAFVYAESGALMNQVVRSVIEQGYQGLEYALGLPGTVAGAVVTNAEYLPSHFVISSVVHKVRVLTKTGEIKEVDATYFQSERGHTNTERVGDIILSVTFVVTPGHKSTLWARGQEAASYRTEIPEKERAYGMTYRSLLLDKTQTMLHHNSLPNLKELLLHAGIPGYVKGQVLISQSNPHFLCNLGEASTKDALSLLHELKKTVLEKYNTSLSIQMGEIGL